MKIVVVDPGHGGSNNGTSDAARGFYEDAWTLDFVESFLSNAIDAEAVEQRKNVVVVQTRHTDKDLSLKQRGEISARLSADLAISVHVNANDSSGVRGFMVFVNRPSLVEPAMRICRAVPKELQRRVGVYDMSRADNQVAWPRVQNVLSAHSCPAMLIECGFRTNPEDFKLLQDNAVKAQIALAVADHVVAAL